MLVDLIAHQQSAGTYFADEGATSEPGWAYTVTLKEQSGLDVIDQDDDNWSYIWRVDMSYLNP